MSKIEDYKNCKAALDKLNRDLALSLGITPNGDTDPRNDKSQFKFVGLYDCSITPYAIGLDAGYGYYGNSSYYALKFDYALVIEALNRNCEVIRASMHQILYERMDTALKAAEDEAKEVLGALKETK